MKKTLVSILALSMVLYAAWLYVPSPLSVTWTEQELAQIDSLALHNLPALRADPSNQVADNEKAAELGLKLFFDVRLSSNGQVSCASCHQPDKYFTDGLQFAVGVKEGGRHTPSLLGVAHSPWFYWNGRKDSQWAQALEPLENELEHGGTRQQYVKLLIEDSNYRNQYLEVFGEIPSQLQTINWNSPSSVEQQAIDRVFSNIGKAIAAYERTLMPTASAFDKYALALRDGQTGVAEAEISASAKAGLKLFIGKAECINCHNGPLLSNHEFHNTGLLSVPGQLPSMGRIEGVRIAIDDAFNCAGSYSDANPSACGELRFARQNDELVGAHKTPTLRNVAETAPYMHAGQLSTLADVINHYDEAELAMVGHNEAEPLGLRPVERRQLETFLEVLTSQ